MKQKAYDFELHKEVEIIREIPKLTKDNIMDFIERQKTINKNTIKLFAKEFMISMNFAKNIFKKFEGKTKEEIEYQEFAKEYNSI
ncbi:MAG: hypothetical protein KJ623_04255 [Nanoarchaeota archaeon]|nr:hypothetical protein [Nanoarchaeota archaeon]MBU0962572.1 hypothetical protein [Nanoarchaeota archaeon]